MPRVTRAALRLNAMLEDTKLAASTPLPLTPLPLRAPLGEITGNSEEVKAMVNNLEELVKAQKKAPPKGRRGKIQSNEKKLALHARREERVEVIEDDNQSATSSAVDEACQELMREPSGEIRQVVIHDQRPRTPPTPAVIMVKKHLSSKAKTQKADPKAPPRTAKMALPDTQKNEHITTTSVTDGMDDLALDKIMVPSPTQLITRIEDSVEAIDAFEEAIEKVGELIPAIPEGPRSPKKVMNAGGAGDMSNYNKTVSIDSNPIAPTKAARPSNVESKRMTTRATIATVSRAKPKRISSIHRAPFQPTKSTKPPTRSNFELPGEAVARKLKEQREERLKREEVEPAKKPVLRSRPARLSQPPVVRQTTTSKARLSLAKTDFKKASPLRQRASVDGTKRVSTVSQTTRTRPSLSAHTTGATGLRLSTIGSTPHVIGVPGPSRGPIAASDAAQLKLRGKEVFNRNRVELDERERARKEKEEAARKARAEAAERGRIASREWAEKQRMKKMATQKENHGN